MDEVGLVEVVVASEVGHTDEAVEAHGDAPLEGIVAEGRGQGFGDAGHLLRALGEGGTLSGVRALRHVDVGGSEDFLDRIAGFVDFNDGKETRSG